MMTTRRELRLILLLAFAGGFLGGILASSLTPISEAQITRGGAGGPWETVGTTARLRAGITQILIPDGSAAAPPIARVADPDDGIRITENFEIFRDGNCAALIGHSGGIGTISLSGTLATGCGGAAVVIGNGGGAGNLELRGGTAPTISAGCGAGATIAGSNVVGTIQLGTATGVCTLTFTPAWAEQPKCFAVSPNTGFVGGAATTTTFTLGVANASTQVDYLCLSS
jgi:hypothetical protein